MYPNAPSARKQQHGSKNVSRPVSMLLTHNPFRSLCLRGLGTRKRSAYPHMRHLAFLLFSPFQKNDVRLIACVANILVRIAFSALGILAARKIENRGSESKHIDEVRGRAGVESFDFVQFSARSKWGSARPA